MTVSWSHPTLQVAERRILSRQRRYLDVGAYLAGEEWRRHRLVLGTAQVYDRCCHCSLIDGADRPYPTTMLVHPWLAELVHCQGEDRRIDDETLLALQPPIVWRGPASGELAVVDIDQAYFQLYRQATLDLAYSGRGSPRQGRIRFLGADELAGEKAARNAVIGAIRAEWRTIAVMGRITRERIAASMRRPALWGYIMSVLHGIAGEMIEHFGALSVCVDGYVLGHHDLAEDAVAWLRSTWGLQASIRCRGEGILTGPSEWRIADVESGYPSAPSALTGEVTTPRSNLVRVDIDPLRDFVYALLAAT